ncbi:MAG: PAP2 superfamily protein [Candidatus Dependentiae bacterium ADurb.Bin331]|nr:MAG: PAP2 superfamily protein [Candidatus Dependentiae bacterium ADurb.Bin331]
MRAILFLVCLIFNNQTAAVNYTKLSTGYERDSLSYKSMYYFSNWCKEFVYIQWNLFSVDSIKVITAALPFYLSSRMIDEELHAHFYDRENHKNRRQIPSGFVNAIEKGSFAAVLFCGSFCIWSPNYHVRTVSRMFTMGVVSGLYAKDLIKCAKTNVNLRPWNEHFSKHKRAHGGFPSGHMFEVSCLATTYGLEFGKRAWIPLGLFTGLVFAVSVNANRHYISQVFAGAALGAIYGIAIHKAIAMSEERLWNVEVNCSREKTEIGVSRRF